MDNLKGICQARILHYDFFAGVFLYELLQKREEILQKQIEILQTQPLTDSKHYQTIRTYIHKSFSQILTEYTATFAIPFNSPTFLYLSYCTNQSLGGESLVFVKALLKDSGFFVDRHFCKENEDHLGILCLFMKFLLMQNQHQNAQIVFQNCITPITTHLIQNFPEQDGFYFHIIKILESFIGIEQEVFDLPT